MPASYKRHLSMTVVNYYFMNNTLETIGILGLSEVSRFGYIAPKCSHEFRNNIEDKSHRTKYNNFLK